MGKPLSLDHFNMHCGQGLQIHCSIGRRSTSNPEKVALEVASCSIPMGATPMANKTCLLQPLLKLATIGDGGVARAVANFCRGRAKLLTEICPIAQEYGLLKMSAVSQSHNLLGGGAVPLWKLWPWLPH